MDDRKPMASAAGDERSRDSLRQCEARFRAIAENVGDAFFLFDLPGGRVLYANPAYETIWSRPRAELYADPQAWLAAVHPDDVPATRQWLPGDRASDPAPCHFRIAGPDGAWRWIEARDFAVRDDDGSLVGIARMARDVTERRNIEQELHESRLRLDSIVASAMDAIISIDEDHRILLANASAEQMFGWPADELVGKPLNLLIPQRYHDEHAERVAAFGNSGATTRRMGALRAVGGLRRNGEEFPIEVSISRNRKGDRRFYTAILRDITDRERAEARNRRLTRVYAVLSAINSLIVRSTRRDELFEQACRIAVEQGDFPVAWIGIVDAGAGRIAPVACAGGPPGFAESLRDSFPLAAADDGHDTLVARAVREGEMQVSDALDGSDAGIGAERLAQGLAAKAVLPLRIDGRTEGVLVLYAGTCGLFDEEERRLLRELADDIAFAIDHIDQAERLHYLACYDALTGMANHALFVERLQQKLGSPRAAGACLAVFVVDIEHFRSFNDAFGRMAGDDLLRGIARRFEAFDEGPVSRFARIGADRFAVFTQKMQQASQVGRYLEQRLDAMFRLPFRVGEADVRVSSKVGVALHPDDGDDAETLLRHAEAALKKAKAEGRRYVFYAHAMTERVAEQLSLETRLRQALENDEFVLHYQPKARLDDGRLQGAEALLRWRDPRSGLVPPGIFIPILEETALIHDVGRWAMRKAVGDYLRWLDRGLPAVRIAVNVSPLQLRDRDFAEQVAAVLGVDKRAPAGLELEITESVIMEDVEQNIAVLQAIRSLGATIAIDDFGTGFSSLSYLSKLPVDTLKIDRSFVNGMVNDPAGMSLVSTIIGLAHALGLKVVAEGVETEEQARFLRLLRCEQMQGYLFGRPVPAEEFESNWLK